MITALGTGIHDEFDIKKLRYDKVILMTDADVDGSHIRTLLLTFFYRQMHDVVAQKLDDGAVKHHLYIAQPPLYRVAKGKSEQYLKDDAALDALLMTMGTEGAVVQGQGGQPVSGALLKALLEKVLAFRRLLAKMDRRRDARVLEAAVNLGVEDAMLRDDARLEQTRASVEAALKQAHAGESVDVKVEPDPQIGSHLVVKLGHSGAVRTTVVDHALVSGPDWAELKTLHASFAALGQAPYTLTAGESSSSGQTAANPGELVDLIKRSASKGLNIQRYKGLGEMNPEQLWSTTMDPSKRTLLEVHADDLAEAELMFTTLMGDAVEPRREFIEKHALDATNLDI
jgi:DNA gyrase subunit B